MLDRYILSFHVIWLQIKPSKGQKPGQAGKGKGKGGSNIFAGLLGKK